MRDALGVVTVICLATCSVACKPKAVSSLQDLATATALKTGMFLPEHRDEDATDVDPVSAASLVKRLGLDLARTAEQDLYVVKSKEGAQILVMKQGIARPLPIGGVTRKGERFFLLAKAIIDGRTGLSLVGGDFYRVDTLDAPLKAYVSADGNSTNMYVQLQVINSLGLAEDYLVSRLALLQTLGSRSIRLAKIGNSIIETKSGKTVLEFRELGNQAWRVYGLYDDANFKHGSVVWSPDMETFYSCRGVGAPVVQWRKQDSNSMDVVASNVDVSIPAAVRNLLADDLVTKDKDRILPTGPRPQSVGSRVVSLAKPAGTSARSRLALTQAGVGRSSVRGEAFYEVEPPAGLALDGPQYVFAPDMSYAPGNSVTLPGNVSGTVAAPTDRTVLSTGEVVRRTYVAMPSGTIREITTVDGANVEQRFLNRVEIERMQQAQATILESPQRAQEEAMFRNTMNDVTEQFQAAENGANDYENRYGTTGGVVSNVVLPVATATAFNVNGLTTSGVPTALPVGVPLTAEQLFVRNTGTTLITSVTGFTQAIYNDQGALTTLSNTGLDTGTKIATAPIDVPGYGVGYSFINMAAEFSSEAGRLATEGRAIDPLMSLGDTTVNLSAPIAGAIMPGTEQIADIAHTGLSSINYSDYTVRAGTESDAAANYYYAPMKQEETLSTVLQNTAPAQATSTETLQGG